MPRYVPHSPCRASVPTAATGALSPHSGHLPDTCLTSLQLPMDTVCLCPCLYSSRVLHPDPTPVPMHLHAGAPRTVCPCRGSTGTVPIPCLCGAMASGRRLVLHTPAQCHGRHLIAAAVSPGANKGGVRVRPGGAAGPADRCAPSRRYLLPFYPSASGGRPSMPRAEHAHCHRPLTRAPPLISHRMGSRWDE